ncbi:hypothetical protein DH2020_003338 [Rehmannia glutinosa]|uniref:Uncharacterized protein n=1 Tax=Rehmannia glutinosa TaxID=99300 RepID=A0ABR0XLC3_REHGL
MSMPVITLTSPSTTNTSHPPEISTSTRDASFSSYLDGAEENFILKLASETTKALNSSISTPHDHIFLGKNKTDDREIDVFDAQKYFNEETHSPTKVVTKNLPTHHQKKDDHHPLEIFAIKEKPSKPKLSIRSESSWNSRSALLHTLIRKTSKPEKQSRKVFLPALPATVLVWTRIPSKSMITRPKNQNRAAIIRLSGNLTRAISVSRFSILNPETRKQPFSFQADIPVRPGDVLCSGGDIEWSVVTASAADFSVLSDSEDSPCPKKEGSINSKIPKLRSGILSGCKSEKAVRIAGDAYRGNNVRAESFTRFQDESKMAGFDARNRQRSFDARVLSQPRSGNAAHLLYT